MWYCHLGAAEGSTSLIEDSPISIFPSNLNYPDSESYTKEAQKKRRNFETHGVHMKIRTFHCLSIFLYQRSKFNKMSRHLEEDILLVSFFCKYLLSIIFSVVSCHSYLLRPMSFVED